MPPPPPPKMHRRVVRSLAAPRPAAARCYSGAVAGAALGAGACYWGDAAQCEEEEKQKGRSFLSRILGGRTRSTGASSARPAVPHTPKGGATVLFLDNDGNNFKRAHLCPCALPVKVPETGRAKWRGHGTEEEVAAYVAAVPEAGTYAAFIQTYDKTLNSYDKKAGMTAAQLERITHAIKVG